MTLTEVNGNYVADRAYGELIETSDLKLSDWIGKQMRMITTGREYIGKQVKWSVDRELHRIYAEYNGMFAVFQLNKEVGL